jgi:queuine tRNA-ribosyltransferase
MMGWDGPILTDSGGFQVMSLSTLRKIDRDGVSFRSHIDGSEHRLTPERSIEIQSLLGADISMQLDECVELPSELKEMQRAMELSLTWAERSKKAFGAPKGRALFGIVQGGDDRDLRGRSAAGLSDIGFDGYAIGGLAVGEPQWTMFEMIAHTAPMLPETKPRYLMGVGKPDDLVGAVERGMDMFDCVHPTRAGRHGHAFTRFGVINLKNSRHRDDVRPLDAESQNENTRTWQRAYLHHLVKANEMLGAMILSQVNLAYYQELMAGMRTAIEAGRFADFVADVREGWERGDEVRDQ